MSDDADNVLRIRFPVHTIVDAKIFKERGLPYAMPKTVGDDRPFIPIFTTEDLAWQFIRSLKMQGKAVMGMRNSKAVSAVLEPFLQVGVKDVGLDVVQSEDGTSGRFYPIGEFIDGLPPHILDVAGNN